MKLPAKIYILRHEPTGKIYVGRTADPEERRKRHLIELRAGRHNIEDLQADYNRYGGSVTFEIIDEVNNWEERDKEWKWQQKLRTYDRRYGYNYKDLALAWHNGQTLLHKPQ